MLSVRLRRAVENVRRSGSQESDGHLDYFGGFSAGEGWGKGRKTESWIQKTFPHKEAGMIALRSCRQL